MMPRTSEGFQGTPKGPDVMRLESSLSYPHVAPFTSVLPLKPNNPAGDFTVSDSYIWMNVPRLAGDFLHPD
ncbi:hypothetical protein PISMIDRAFT_676834, partial [Pisolithus microcarpus 441]